MKKIILIGNYPLDQQESMQRFAHMLSEGLATHGIETEIWKPIVFFGRLFKVTNSGLGKWFGYVDKYLLFPIVLKLRLSRKKNQLIDIKFHICDHSNAPYLKYLPKGKTGITCHDVLAIRGSLGYDNAYAPASITGKLLQKWILNNLIKAETLAAVSNLTLNQLKEISPQDYNHNNWVVIHNGFNAAFKPIEPTLTTPLLLKMGLQRNDSFILHVGSGELRKNRKLLLQMAHSLGNEWQGKICFAGKPLDSDMIELAKSLKLVDRVVSITNPTHEVLRALYSRCEAFIFPSFSEGFGWPVIEAQACGAPVIASSLEPMPEVSGGRALYAHPENPDDFANAFLSLRNSDIREKVINLGYTNIERFHRNTMINAYMSLYQIKNKLNISK